MQFKQRKKELTKSFNDSNFDIFWDADKVFKANSKQLSEKAGIAHKQANKA